MGANDFHQASASVASQIATSIAEQLLRSDTTEGSDPAKIYSQAISFFVDTVLQQRRLSAPSEATFFGSNDRSATAMFSQLTPEAVGRLYEHLRGFRLELKPGQRPALVPSTKGRRNQGLFYTPHVIVQHIVGRALDALEVHDPADYLKVKILDPAMGTGVFLAEALEEITSRVTRGASREGGTQAREAREHVRGSGKWDSGAISPDELTSLHALIVGNCLYGVDVDPVAVRIARAVLLERVFKDRPPFPGIETHLKVGNALMGTAIGEPHSLRTDTEDERHFLAYLGRGPQDSEASATWAGARRVFHWPIEFPAVFASEGGGFDAVVGNPPYEIVSVKESGIVERMRDQAYFRRMYRTCVGKINTYRLMMERAFDLLRSGGILGFIVPATFLADSTAEPLRKLILDGASILETVMIPEKARVFHGVTQALLVLIARKGSRTGTLRPISWDGTGLIPDTGPVQIERHLLNHTSYRIPLLKDATDKKLLEALTRHPRFSSAEGFSAVGTVHQGEINLTVHRQFVTNRRTAYPLIRGEHVTPLHIVHPYPGRGRLDWVASEFLERGLSRETSGTGKTERRTQRPSRSRMRGTPWERERIVLARVVNMGTDRRLKAAIVSSGTFLGDMTNFIADSSVPANYLLGLLNSRLLNWRFKLTSTNNYLSAREIEDLPVARPTATVPQEESLHLEPSPLEPIFHERGDSIAAFLGALNMLSGSNPDLGGPTLTPQMIEWTVERLRADHCPWVPGAPSKLWNLLDALVLKLYRVEAFVRVFER